MKQFIHETSQISQLETFFLFNWNVKSALIADIF